MLTIIILAMLTCVASYLLGARRMRIACGKIAADELYEIETAAGFPHDGLPSIRWRFLKHRLAALRARAESHALPR